MREGAEEANEGSCGEEREQVWKAVQERTSLEGFSSTEELLCITTNHQQRLLMV